MRESNGNGIQNGKELKEAPEDVPHLARLVENNSKQPLITPTCSQWFKFDEIHEIEAKAFPDYFCGRYPSKSPEIYKEARNYIINLYRENVNCYLTSTTCRRHLSGDVCSIMRMHAFLEHWGLINFNIDPNTKPVNPLTPKVFNYKTPVYVDASTFLTKENNSNISNKIGENAIILTDGNGGELRTVFPITNNPDNLFRNIFNKNSSNLPTQLNFISKNYRPKCDMCDELCDIEWYIQKVMKENDSHMVIDSVKINPNSNTNLSKPLFLVCDKCFDQERLPRDLAKEDFVFSNFFSVIGQLTGQENRTLSLKEHIVEWKTSETVKLIEAIEKYGENWDEVVKVFNGSKSKNDCIVHFMQLPIKENIQFKINDSKPASHVKPGSITNKEINALADTSNPIIAQVVFFSKMFEQFSENDYKEAKEREERKEEAYKNSLINGIGHGSHLENRPPQPEYNSIEDLRKVIYKTHSTATDKSKDSKKKERKKLKNIMNLIIYLQMKKVELKLSYFNEYEKLVQLEKQQIKTMESQLLGDKIHLAMKKSELAHLTNKLKESTKPNTDIFESSNQQEYNSIIERANKFQLEFDTKVIELN